MSTEIIVAIIGAVAVITAAIIAKKPPKAKEEKCYEKLHQQKADVEGDCNEVGQSMNGGVGSQTATIKGNRNSINQKNKVRLL